MFEQTLAGNVAEGNNAVVHGTPPFHVRVTTTGYTAIISVGISADVASAEATPLGSCFVPPPAACEPN